MQIINQYQDGEYTITEYDTGLIERRLRGVSVEASEGKRITKRALKHRFPRAKWMAARAASTSSNVLADFFESFDLATFIDLEDPDLVEAVSLFSAEATPVEMRLNSEEAASVLSPVITDKERYI